MEIAIDQSGNRMEFEGLQLNPTPATQTLNLSVPGLQSGPALVTIERIDIFGASYRPLRQLHALTPYERAQHARTGRDRSMAGR